MGYLARHRLVLAGCCLLMVSRARAQDSAMAEVEPEPVLVAPSTSERPSLRESIQARMAARRERIGRVFQRRESQSPPDVLVEETSDDSPESSNSTPWTPRSGSTLIGLWRRSFGSEQSTTGEPVESTATHASMTVETVPSGPDGHDVSAEPAPESGEKGLFKPIVSGLRNAFRGTSPTPPRRSFRVVAGGKEPGKDYSKIATALSSTATENEETSTTARQPVVYPMRRKPSPAEPAPRPSMVARAVSSPILTEESSEPEVTTVPFVEAEPEEALPAPTIPPVETATPKPVDQVDREALSARIRPLPDRSAKPRERAKPVNPVESVEKAKKPRSRFVPPAESTARPSFRSRNDVDADQTTKELPTPKKLPTAQRGYSPLGSTMAPPPPLDPPLMIRPAYRPVSTKKVEPITALRPTPPASAPSSTSVPAADTSAVQAVGSSTPSSQAEPVRAVAIEIEEPKTKAEDKNTRATQSGLMFMSREGIETSVPAKESSPYRSLSAPTETAPPTSASSDPTPAPPRDDLSATRRPQRKPGPRWFRRSSDP